MREKTERSPLSRFARWTAELILVFAGVYGAFWLNNYQQHRQDAQRRDQILISLEQELRDGIESGKIAGAKEDREAAEFRRELDATVAAVCFHGDHTGGVGLLAIVRTISHS